MQSPIFVNIVADYGTGDGAFAEVTQKLWLELPTAQVQALSVPSFDTRATGFWNAQLGLNPGPAGRIIYHNCAPRKDNLKARGNNEGEALTYALLPNNVKVIGVNAGYTLSFIKNHAKVLRVINVPRCGSQFRSRDIFPEAIAALAQGDESLLGETLPLENIPDLPLGEITWIDGYGNLKTTIPAHSIDLTPGSLLNIKVGNVTVEAIYADGSFAVPDGYLAFAPGSSGWPSADGQQQLQWMELFLRGGSAWDKFNRPRIGTSVTQQANLLRLTGIEAALGYAV